MAFGQIEVLTHNHAQLAFERQGGAAPTFIWLGGFRSEMAGTKAQALAQWAHDRGQGFVRFDYSGHGRSSGRFEACAISDWLEDTLAVIDRLTRGALVLVGSSMGGWLALLAARARPARVKGLLLIAPAADMTERLMWAGFDATVRQEIERAGQWAQPSAYDPAPTIITRRLIEDGRRHLLMDAPIAFAGAVRILQGGQDPDVPVAHVQALAGLLRAPDLRMDLIADGDHRLSRRQDLDRLLAVATELAEPLAP